MEKQTVFIAPPGATGKRADIFQEITAHCPDNDFSSVLYIAPTSFNRKEAGRQFFGYMLTDRRKNVYVPFDSLTIKDFCSSLYEKYGMENIISARIEPLVICEILGEKNIGYARLLSDLLRTIVHHILDKDIPEIKEDVKLQIFEEKTVKQAVKALETIEIYRGRLKEKGLIDFESAMKGSISMIEKHAEPEILVLDGFFDPTPLELKVIEALIQKSKKTLVAVEENAEFVKFFKTYGNRVDQKRLNPVNYRADAGYFQYLSMEDEIEGIARGVKDLILEGMKPGEISVSFPQLSKYTPMLKRVFQKHGIPVSLAEHDLSGAKPFSALEDMLTSIEDDYPRNEFLSVLTSAHFPDIPGVIKEWAVSLSYRAGIVSGRHSWCSIEKTLLGTAEEKISDIERKIFKEFQREINKIINLLEKIRQQRGISGFADELETVLRRFGFFDSIEGSSNLRYSDDISRRINEQFSEFRHFAGIYGSEEAGFEKSGFYFKQLIKGAKGSDRDVNGVRVIPFELAAGLECRALFFGGVIEGDIPSTPAIDPILPEKVKKSFGLPYLEYYLDRQKRYFRRLLNISVDTPYFSYPAADGDKMFLPSPFLNWEMSFGTPVLNILTEEELLVREGGANQKNFSDTLWGGKLHIDKDIKGIIQKRFGTETFFRITDIDAYRRCPLRFYIEKFLYFEKEEPPRFEIDAGLWGKLAHKTMEYLFRDRDVDIETIDKKFFQGFRESLKKYPVGVFWSKVAEEVFQRLLPLIKEREADIRAQGFSPYAVEKSVKTELHGLRIKGKIDRIDLKKRTMDDGRRTKDEEKDSVILLDYKTGTIDKDSLQLPLYACMWQEEEKDRVERAGYYSLKDCSVQLYPKKTETMEVFIKNALDTAEELVRRMRKGVFTPVPFKAGECGFCNHSALCKGSG